MRLRHSQTWSSTHCGRHARRGTSLGRSTLPPAARHWRSCSMRPVSETVRDFTIVEGHRQAAHSSLCRPPPFCLSTTRHGVLQCGGVLASRSALEVADASCQQLTPTNPVAPASTHAATTRRSVAKGLDSSCGTIPSAMSSLRAALRRAPIPGAHHTKRGSMAPPAAGAEPVAQGLLA